MTISEVEFFTHIDYGEKKNPVMRKQSLRSWPINQIIDTRSSSGYSTKSYQSTKKGSKGN
ncbi:hypothetical protein RE476_09290 [Methanolobus mangrovi]|uniref:Uncharacterized protein n=1 Tax=Methanolobus mangrovi TaxID=3072977 RepID=A0AA51UEP2_9EURY|nr:hypothetical protein [Methanolobus mangrovi]WMW21578.1 hypothetical protein RE476_09290 [Methanolobus mangrovi]